MRGRLTVGQSPLKRSILVRIQASQQMQYNHFMNTVIFPGYSLKNKSWAEEIQKELAPFFTTSVVNWKHWKSGKSESGWIEKEAKKLIESVGEKQVNIIAKSIGTTVAMVILKSNPESIGKLILCGVPILDFHPDDKNYYKPLKNYQPEKFLCFQNDADNHGSYNEVNEFLHSLNQKLKIISKPRSDHEYPYAKEFIDFLKK